MENKTFGDGCQYVIHSSTYEGSYYCTHDDNLKGVEGNCNPESCPLGKHLIPDETKLSNHIREFKIKSWGVDTKEEELAKMIKENPELEVVWMVPSGTEDQHQHYEAHISRVEIGLYCLYNDRIHHDEGDLIEDLENDLHPDYEMTEEELEIFAREQYDLLDKKQVIYVYFVI